ncbi:MAG: lytic transglycosylase domain-containing protein [Desulfatiglandales bacterium]
MPDTKTPPDSFFITVLACLILAGLFVCPLPALADYPLLAKLIIAYNSGVQEKSLANGSYRGEEGLLRLTPEAAKSLGIKAVMNEDYNEAKALLKNAERCLEKAQGAIALRKWDASSPDHYTRDIIEPIISYKRDTAAAQEKLKAYHAALTPEEDERLDPALSMKALNRLLDEGLNATKNRLRDALGYFYNHCRGDTSNSHYLTPENVPFVNQVFLAYLEQAPKASVERFDLDRAHDSMNPGVNNQWKRVMEKTGFPYITALETAVTRQKAEGNIVDPLLFVALMRRESRFDPLAVSSVGAAGLTQIMPQTALSLGMTQIYVPDYFKEAVTLISEERKLGRDAMNTLFRIADANGLKFAKDARQLMQSSLDVAEKKEKLFRLYKQDLLKGKTDERLKPERAIEFGYRYFAQMMRLQNGDISLALASYNAGPHRVERYRGIPPFRETVHFRNKVMEFYREYLEMARLLQ